MTDRCTECGRSRWAGWLLIDGLCRDCGPQGFEKRRAELKRQAAELKGKERRGHSADWEATT